MRAITIGVICVAILSFAVPYSDLLLNGTWIACSHLAIGPIILFFPLVTLLNYFLRKYSPLTNTLFLSSLGVIGIVLSYFLLRHIGGIALIICSLLFFFLFLWSFRKISTGKPISPLSQSELLIIYSMMLVGTGIPSFGLTAYLVPTLLGGNYFATPENKWRELFYHYTPKWLVPWDPSGKEKQFVSVAFYEGLHYGEPIPWKAWVVPLIAWTIFALLLFFMMICLASILRRQWVEGEKLIFPLVQVPMEMAREDGGVVNPFFRNKLMWLGFAIPFIIHTINAFHYYFPYIPELTLHTSLNQFLPNPPWNQIGIFEIWVHFSVIGLSFIIASDLAFSLWFFFLLFKVEAAIAASFGMKMDYVFTYPVQVFAAYQMLGAFIVLTFYMLWTARHYIREVLLKAFTNRSSLDDSKEPMPYRVAVWGFLISAALLVAWCGYAGMNILVAIVVLILFVFFIMLPLTRFVSEGGLLFIQAPFQPTEIINSFARSDLLGGKNLTILAYIQRIFMFDLRASLLPSVMDAFKISDSTRYSKRHFLMCLILAILVAIGGSYISELWMIYRRGGVSMSPWFLLAAPQQPFQFLASALQNPTTPDWRAGTFLGVGLAIAIFLTQMRLRFTWWPLHPLGYAMGPSWPMIQLWFSIMVGWFIKVFILKAGGMKAFNRARPFFLGMILGEFVVGGIWIIIDGITGMQGHRIFLT
ncbi:hypothetical protein H5T87_07280 [bacterium]|nr:hypothetical protein [bacterium]